MQYIKNSEKLEIENYPYGYNRTTTKYHSVERNKRGYRTVAQTINPKTGKLNKPKKSTYSDFILRYYDENNHVKIDTFDVRSLEDVNRILNLFKTNFDVLDKKDIEQICLIGINGSRLSARAIVQFAGADADKVVAYLKHYGIVKKLVEQTKTEKNILKDVELFDLEKWENLKEPDFNPFTVKTYEPK